MIYIYGIHLLKKGDVVDVELNINGDTLLYDRRKSVIWQGSFCKCSFDYNVPLDLDVKELSCSVNLYVNGAIVGEMSFPEIACQFFLC